jgi:hypothetical protein
VTISKSETFKLQERELRLDGAHWRDLRLRCPMPTTIEGVRVLRDSMVDRWGANNLRIVRVRTREDVVE